MYWPVGTSRIYATSSSAPSSSTAATSPNPETHISHDGLPPPTEQPSDVRTERSASLLTVDSSSSQDATALPPTPITPVTPFPPVTPGIKPVEHDYPFGSPTVQAGSETASIPLHEPILALRVSRTGHVFAVITATSITIWQTKPTVVLAVVVRSHTSLNSYGTNVNLLLRPDSCILVVHTSLGYLITYTVATDADAPVYKPHFLNHTNVQRRRQSHGGGPGHAAPDQILWGPGEGAGVRDISVRFRMVIKVDAGIECALALDDELVVATRKPAAIQCIRWTPDSSGNQTTTEILSRMGWLEKKVTIKEMTHDRPMNLSTWITSDGRAYAVQRINQSSSTAAETNGGDPVDPKKLYKGYCFHIPKGAHDLAVKSVVNARFSLVAVGCADGSIHVYSARDYSGNIPPSHIHKLPVSSTSSGALSTLSYSPDGYCLFAGYEKGWATWSVYGKPLGSSFQADSAIASSNGEEWLSGVLDAAWVGGGSEILLASRSHEAIWLLEMARSAVTGCYSSANLFRTVLQTTSSVMVYRGYDLPDLTSISAEPFLWHTTRIPATYLLNQWPIKCTVISPDGRYVAVAGRRGLAHYSISSGRWKTFANEIVENEFQVRGGMCWYQNILVAAVEANRTYELRLYSRESSLDANTALHVQQMPSPVVLMTPSGEDSLLVYTYDNLLYHYIFAPVQGGGFGLVEVGHIAFHGIIRSPPRVRGLSWIIPERQLLEGDPSQDVAVASVLFLVDGKLVLLQPSVNQEGQLKYDMRVIAQNVEYYTSMRDQPFTAPHLTERRTSIKSNGETGTEDESLQNSLWIFDGSDLKMWTDMETVLKSIGDEHNRELPDMVSIPVDFYPLSTLLGKATVLGVEADLVQRRDINFSFFRFTIRTHLFLPEILRHFLTHSQPLSALSLARTYSHLAYFAHALEILLHHVLDEEVDRHPPPPPESAILPRVLSLLSSFKQYLDIVVQCTRKTEVRSWRTLFAYLPPPQELFEESLQRGSLKTAGGYLLILHTFDENMTATASEQSVRLLGRAMREGDWELCKELARFLAALDETGDTLREALGLVGVGGGLENGMRSSPGAGGGNVGLGIQLPGGGTGAGVNGRLEVPSGRPRLGGGSGSRSSSGGSTTLGVGRRSESGNSGSEGSEVGGSGGGSDV